MKFDHFMSLKGVITKIKTRVHNFFELIWQFQIKTDSQTQKSTIQKLPLSIQQDLLAQISFSHEISFLNSLPQGEEIQKILSFRIKSYVVDPNATVYEMGAPLDAVGEGYVYYVRNGLAKYCWEYAGDQRVIGLSNSRKITGEYEYVTGLSHCFNCKSIDLCVIERISYSELNGIVRNFGLGEEMAMLRCRVLLYGELKLVELRCMVCDGGHTENCCSTIMAHYDIKQQYEQNRQKNIGTNQPRRPFTRKSKNSQIISKESKKTQPNFVKSRSRTRIAIPHSKLKQRMRLKKHQSFAYKTYLNLQLLESKSNGSGNGSENRYAESLYWNVDVMAGYERYYPEFNVVEEGSGVHRSVVQ